MYGLAAPRALQFSRCSDAHAHLRTLPRRLRRRLGWDRRRDDGRARTGAADCRTNQGLSYTLRAERGSDDRSECSPGRGRGPRTSRGQLSRGRADRRRPSVGATSQADVTRKRPLRARRCGAERRALPSRAICSNRGRSLRVEGLQHRFVSGRDRARSRRRDTYACYRRTVRGSRRNVCSTRTSWYCG